MAGGARAYDSAPIGLCVFDLELRYVHINAWLALINGVTADEHLGRMIGDVLPHVADAVESQLRHVIETGEPNLGGTAVAETPAHPGATHCYRHNYVAIRGDAGTITGVSVVVEDLGPCASSESIRVEVADAGPATSASAALTAREAEVLRAVAQGLTSRHIAARWGLSVRTVEAHRRSIAVKLGVSGTAALTEFAKRARLV